MTTSAPIAQAADRLLALPYETWAFGDSVGFEALLAATPATGDSRYAAFAHGFFRAWATRAEPYRPLDCTAPGLAMTLGAEQTGDARLLDAAARLADYLAGRRLVGGVFATWERSPLRHPYGPGSLPPDEAALLRDPGAGVFVDCLHFDPPFFAALGRVAGEPGFIRLAIEQAVGYVQLLQDPTGGLFHHFWLEKTERPYILGWGRGQGWALLGLLDVLEQQGWRADADPGDGLAMLADAAHRLADAMRGVQRPDGHWWAVVQDPQSGNETSTAAFMAVAFARGRALGLLGDDYREPEARALAAIRAATNVNGVLTGVSAAVWACTSPNHYAHVPRGFLVPWGQGPLVLALARAESAAALAPEIVPAGG
ncbi:MAG: glycoside hydrolase family 88 protein [Thermomicrobiales bacterium]|nr:glycoside hydrolase family 88 protein [Thermomicrobiales bacterium]